MKYVDLIDLYNLILAEATFNQQLDKPFSIRRSFSSYAKFIYFRPKEWYKKYSKVLNINWKAHISIHSQDKCQDFLDDYSRNSKNDFSGVGFNGYERTRNKWSLISVIQHTFTKLSDYFSVFFISNKPRIKEIMKQEIIKW